MGRKKPDEVIICCAILQEQKTIVMDYPDHDTTVTHQKTRDEIPIAGGRIYVADRAGANIPKHAK